MLVAGAALIVALAATASAGTPATKSALNKPQKKAVKRLIQNAAPGLSVANARNAENARNADTVDGANASDLRTASAFAENPTSSTLPAFPSFANVASATITTQASGRVLATASVELEGADADERGQCVIRIDGEDSQPYEVQPDDIGAGNEVVVAATFAVTRGPGTYTASLECRSLTGTVGEGQLGDQRLRTRPLS